jgi:hypothetical protein
MIIRTSNGQTFDTETDLSAAERHILQKLFSWKSFVTSINEFRKKKDLSFKVGWNDSGPVPESSAMRLIISDIENEISTRLSSKGGA